MLRLFGLPQSILQKQRTQLAPYASADALTALDSTEVGTAVARALEWAAAPGHAETAELREDILRRFHKLRAGLDA